MRKLPPHSIKSIPYVLFSYTPSQKRPPGGHFEKSRHRAPPPCQPFPAALLSSPPPYSPYKPFEHLRYLLAYLAFFALRGVMGGAALGAEVGGVARAFPKESLWRRLWRWVYGTGGLCGDIAGGCFS